MATAKFFFLCLIEYRNIEESKKIVQEGVLGNIWRVT
jgi:hypothetical protein